MNQIIAQTQRHTKSYNDQHVNENKIIASAILVQLSDTNSFGYFPRNSHSPDNIIAYFCYYHYCL